MKLASAASRVQANLQELFKANLSPGDAYLKFQLTSDLTALLSMEQVEESLIVEAERITPIPNLPESVIGIVNSRERVFCVFDLAQLLTETDYLSVSRQYQIIVLRTNFQQPIHLGLAVNFLQGILRFPADKIQLSLDSFPKNITPYLCGVVQENQAILPIMDFRRILEALTTINELN